MRTKPAADTSFSWGDSDDITAKWLQVLSDGKTRAKQKVFEGIWEEVQDEKRSVEMYANEETKTKLPKTPQC